MYEPQIKITQGLPLSPASALLDHTSATEDAKTPKPPRPISSGGHQQITGKHEDFHGFDDVSSGKNLAIESHLIGISLGFHWD